MHRLWCDALVLGSSSVMRRPREAPSQAKVPHSFRIISLVYDPKNTYEVKQSRVCEHVLGLYTSNLFDKFKTSNFWAKINSNKFVKSTCILQVGHHSSPTLLELISKFCLEFSINKVDRVPKGASYQPNIRFFYLYLVKYISTNTLIATTIENVGEHSTAADFPGNAGNGIFL